jgi:hypothetical protein
MSVLTLTDHQQLLAATSARRVAAGESPVISFGQRFEQERGTMVYPTDHFYFQHVHADTKAEIYIRANTTRGAHAGSKTTILMSSNSELTGKMGEWVAEGFFWTHYGAPINLSPELVQTINATMPTGCTQHTLEGLQARYAPVAPWETLVHDQLRGRGDVTDFRLHGMSVDVKTRGIRNDRTFPRGFELMVPKHELRKYQDAYLLAAYCDASAYAYILGWCSWEELQAKEITEAPKIPFSAKCVPLFELHPPDTLSDYLATRAAHFRGENVTN